jgi:lipoate-protein ligase A
VTTRWRLLDCGPRPGDHNMALDRALLERVAAGRAAPILRFYSWDRPTLSFGRMQHPPPELLGRCRELGVAAVRRPTGGKAILHHREVTFSIIAPTAGLGSVMQSYRTFARAIAAGLRGLGVEARLCDAHASAPGTALLCFADPAGCDLEADGRKLVGSAQARRGPALLQQNSLPLRLAHALKDDLFGAAAQEEARLATDLFSALGREPSFAEVRDAIVAGFRPELGIEFESGPVSADESAAAQKLQPAFVL